MDLGSWLHSLFYYFYALFISLNLLASASGSCLADQQSSLLQLKESFSHSDLSSWLPGTDCCHGWEGVSCNESTGHVTVLDLSNRNISTAGLSDAICNLTSLRHLNLANNNFWGNQIPDGFEKLIMLTHLNLSYSNFSGQIPIGIANLTNLITLDLSCLRFNLKLQKPNMRTLISNLSYLRELHLNGVQVSENGRGWCEALSDSVPLLRVLSLSYCGLRGPIEMSLSRLNSLAVIHLTHNYWLSSPIPSFFANFPLQDLRLSICDFTGLFPSKIFHIPTLTTLDISGNSRLFGTLPDFLPGSSLERLFLDGTQFSNRIPDSIGNLGNLSLLYLSGCNFSGQIPFSITNLVKLEALELSDNSLSGSIPPALFSLPNLQTLDLSSNMFSGQYILEEAPFVLSSSLTGLFLRGNQLNGSILTAIYKFPNLETLDLGLNQFSGPIPTSIFGISSLRSIYLDSNNLNGTVELSLLQQLSNLTTLQLSHNQLFVEDISDGQLQFSFPKISTLGLASCNLTEIPRLLRYLDDLQYVDLSNNHMHGVIPTRLWEKFAFSTQLNTNMLNLSRNIFTGVEDVPQSSVSYNPYFYMIDLSFNKLTGALPLVSGHILDYSNNEFSQIPSNYMLYLKYTFFLSLTANRLTGEISSSICEAPQLSFLDLSKNNLSGLIPSCILVSSELSFLNLASNQFHGVVPRNVSKSCSILILNLSHNNLHGDLPRSLTRCKDLVLLNIGNNRIMDSFPFWLWEISKLQVIIIGTNQLYGALELPSRYARNNSSMRIIDFSSNNLNGSLPPLFFKSWNSMVNLSSNKLTAEAFINSIEYDSYGIDGIDITVIDKGIEIILGEHLASIMVEIDLSNNKFTGDIPETLGKLSAIKGLNLSHNAFNGNIPHCFKNLIQLESLDLSWNNLSGEIPEELTTIDTLSKLDLSFNHLFGRIPQSPHFSTFDNSSFQGNPGLCGVPLSEQCEVVSQGNNATSPPTRSAQNISAAILLCLFIGLGFGTGFAIVILWLVIKSARKGQANG